MLYSRFIAAALLTSCVLSTPVLATDSTVALDNTPVTRAQLPGLIREILINDPTIFMDVVEKMQSAQKDDLIKKSQEGIAKNRAKIFSDPNSPTIGAKDADVTFVEFFDYHCGYCKQALVSINKLIESDKKVRFVFKEFPILSEDSKLAAKAALAVNRIDKNKYLDFHKAMFAINGSITQDIIDSTATRLGIDPKKLKTEMANPEIEAILAGDKQLASDLGVQGTPALIIGDNFYPGAIPYEAMQKAIADVRNPPKKDAAKAQDKK